MSAVPPKIPAAQELYDALMSKIEPELTSAGLKTLKAKYPSETPEQKKSRMDHYNAAFAAYDQALEQYMTELRKNVDAYRKVALREAEQVSRSEEDNKLSHLETLFSQKV